MDLGRTLVLLTLSNLFYFVHPISSPPGCDQLDRLAINALYDYAHGDFPFKEARSSFELILGCNPYDFQAWEWKGHLDVASGDLSIAELSLKKALLSINMATYSQEPLNDAIKSFEARINMQLGRVQARVQALNSSRGNRDTRSEEKVLLAPHLSAFDKRQIQRIVWNELDQSRFRADFISKGEPVIVTGLPSLYTFTVDDVEETCGMNDAEAKVYDTSSGRWAGLLEPFDIKISDLINDSVNDGAMLFDWNLKEGCPALLDRVFFPRLFAQNTAAYFGPSLFLQPAQTQSGMHVDAWATSFWQFLHVGRKRWRVVRPEDWSRVLAGDNWRRAFFPDKRCTGMFGGEPRARAIEAGECRGTVLPDPFDDEALSNHLRNDVTTSAPSPLLVFEGEAEKGDLVIIPPGAPHAVHNVEYSLAVSANVVNMQSAAATFEMLKSQPMVHQDPDGIKIDGNGLKIAGFFATDELDDAWYRKLPYVLNFDNETTRLGELSRIHTDGTWSEIWSDAPFISWKDFLLSSNASELTRRELMFKPEALPS